MKTLSKIAVTFIAVLMSTSAMAQVSSTVSINNTGYQLIDLDGNDGITPEISFFGTSNSAQASVTTGTYSDGYTASAVRNASTSRTNIIALGDTTTGAGASYSGGAFGSVSSNGQIGEVGSYNASQQFQTGFSLSPKTLLLVFGHLTGSVTGGGSYYQSSASSGTISLTGALTPDGYGSQSSSIGDSAYSYYYNSAFDHTFALSFANGNTSSLNGNFRVSTNVSGQSSVGFSQPVPEPETYAMMLMGLGLLAFAKRRKANGSKVG
jgi:PEP-CTERM motif